MISLRVVHYGVNYNEKHLSLGQLYVSNAWYQIVPSYLGPVRYLRQERFGGEEKHQAHQL